MLAEDHDVLLAFVKPSLESPKALHINASLGFEDGVAVRELPVEIRLASHALLGAALAIGREAPRPRALDEEDADGGQHDHHDQGDARRAAHDQLV
jgi:hypothetical protein